LRLRREIKENLPEHPKPEAFLPDEAKERTPQSTSTETILRTLALLFRSSPERAAAIIARIVSEFELLEKNPNWRKRAGLLRGIHWRWGVECI